MNSATAAAMAGEDDLVTIELESGFVVHVEARGQIVSTSQTCATYEEARLAKVAKESGLRSLCGYTARVQQVGF